MMPSASMSRSTVMKMKTKAARDVPASRSEARPTLWDTYPLSLAQPPGLRDGHGFGQRLLADVDGHHIRARFNRGRRTAASTACGGAAPLICRRVRREIPDHPVDA